MKKNVGVVDRMLRILAGISLWMAYLIIHPPGKLAILMPILGTVLILTAFIGFCPLYRLFGWTTGENGRKKRGHATGNIDA